MKGIVTFLCSLVVVFMLVIPGNAASAHEGGTDDGDGCGCGVTYLEGAERNKEVAKILGLEAYHRVKADFEAKGYEFEGANRTAAVLFPIHDTEGNVSDVLTMVAIPFVNEAGEEMVVVYVDGEFAGIAPGPIPY